MLSTFNLPWQAILTLAVLIAYFFYYRKYRRYQWIQKGNNIETKNFRGKSLPCFPNGWFKLLNSEDLKREEVKYIDYCGRNLAVYRGKDNKVYALEAYCAHMGANMALGGSVKLGKGLQCPFHGWVYDGDTGNCVVDGKMEQKEGEVYSYHNMDTCEKVNGSVLKKECSSKIKVNKYPIREIKGQIFCWFHSVEALRETPLFDPLQFDHGLEHRGESLNYVNSHIQDIPENASDLKHFHYVHTQVFNFTKKIMFKWNLNWARADDPNLYEIMKLDNPKRDAFRKDLFKKTITEENKAYLSCLGLENTLCIFGWEIKFFALSGFQLGPGLVYLVLDSPFFTTALQQSVTPTEKYMQHVWHRIYTNSWLPYWVSASMLVGEVSQVLADVRIWNNKKYTPKLVYDMSTKADKMLYDWRTWYGQFYEGCSEREKEVSKYDW